MADMGLESGQRRWLWQPGTHGVVRRSALGIGNESELLQRYLEHGRSASARIGQRIAHMQRQIVILQGIADGATFSSSVRDLARANLAQSDHVLRDYVQFRTDVATWMTSVQAELTAVRGSDIPYPMDPQDRANLRTLRDRWATLQMGLAGLEALTTEQVNDNFITMQHVLVQMAPQQAAGTTLSTTSTTTAQDSGTSPVVPCVARALRVGCNLSHASTAGRPEGVATQERARHASQETLARLFRLATPELGNVHCRRYQLDDGSSIVLQAYKPVLGMSMESGLFRALATAVGAALGLVIGPTAAVAGGAVAAATVSAVRPYDVAWQGYRADYFNPSDAQSVQLTRYFYGWRTSSSLRRAVTVCGETEVHRFCDFADDFVEASWWSWGGSGSAPRAPQFVAPPVSAASMAAPPVDGLIQYMAGWGASGAGVDVAPAQLHAQQPVLAPGH